LAPFLLLKLNTSLPSHVLVDVVMVVAEMVAVVMAVVEMAAAEAMDVEMAVAETAVVEMAVAEIMDAEMAVDPITIAMNVTNVTADTVVAMTEEMMVAHKMTAVITAVNAKVETVATTISVEMTAMTTVEVAKVAEMVVAVATTSEVTTDARTVVVVMVDVVVSPVKTVDITAVLLLAEKTTLVVKTVGRRRNTRAREHLRPVHVLDPAHQEQTFPDVEALLLVHLSERSDGSSKNSSSFMSIDLVGL